MSPCSSRCSSPVTFWAALGLFNGGGLKKLSRVRTRFDIDGSVSDTMLKLQAGRRNSRL